MARTHSEAEHSDAVKLRAFYERARQIRTHSLFAHPNASLIHPNMPEGTSIQNAASSPDVDHKMESIDWKLYSSDQWTDLACLVRPRVFSNTDKIRWLPILQIISHADESLKPLADAVNNTYKNWVKTLFFGMLDLGDATEQDENTVRMAALLDIDLSDIASDYAMAQKVLNGEIFHVNLDYWVWMNQFPDGVVRAAYLKAAQYRVVSSCIHIENVRQLIMMGWQTEILPVLAESS